MMNVMEDSEHFGDIAYYLGCKKARLATAALYRHDNGQGRGFDGRIEDKFLNPPEPKATTAPAKTGKAGNKATKHPSKMTSADYRKWRESGGGGRGA